MGILIAAVIVLALVFYAVKDLLTDKDFASWLNMALTSLILFTVILSIFMILNKKNPEDNTTKPIQKPAAQETAPTQPQVPVEEMTDNDIMLAIAVEYVQSEEGFKAKNNPNAQKAAGDYIINKYNFTVEEWNSFLEDAAKNDLFTKARAKLATTSSDINYLIKK